MTEIHTQVSNKVSHSSELVENNSFQPDLPQKPSRKAGKPLLKLVKIALLVGVGYGIYRFFVYQPEPDGLFLSGRIESYETNVSAKIGGRVAQVEIEEGNLVKPGQTLVKIDDADTQAQLQGAIAQVKAKQEQLQRLRQQLPVIEAQLQQANLLTQQTREESKGKVVEAENNLAVAQSQLAQAQANLKLALIKQQRIHSLFAEGAVAAQQQDEIDSQVEVYQANVAMAQQQVKAAQGVLTQARSSLRNPPIRAAAELEIKRKLTQAHTDIAIAEQDIRNAQANQAHIQANLNYLLIKSPIAGNVITKIIEPGEVVAAGAPLLTLVNLDRLYLRGFIPEEQIGQVTLGLKSLVYLDSFPKQPLEATVTRIDPKASFTPKNIYFKKDRVTQVFGIELTLKNPQGKAKPGMPADGRILIQKTQPEKSSGYLPDALRFLGL
jgi:HlyD family secretion protein